MTLSSELEEKEVRLLFRRLMLSSIDGYNSALQFGRSMVMGSSKRMKYFVPIGHPLYILLSSFSYLVVKVTSISSNPSLTFCIMPAFFRLSMISLGSYS